MPVRRSRSNKSRTKSRSTRQIRTNSKRKIRKSVSKRILTRKQKQLKKNKSLLATLNQMGGFIRDGSTQFFKLLKDKK